LTNNRLSTPLGGINPTSDVGARRTDWMGVDRKTSSGGFDGRWGHIVLVKSYRYHPDAEEGLKHEVEFIHSRGSTGVEEKNPTIPHIQELTGI
jgi:hypothetical protein